MNSGTASQIIQILTVILIPVVIALIGAVIFLVFLYFRGKKKEENKETFQGVEKEKNTSEYNRQSIFKFMDFDSVEDNMIIQKKGKKYIMVIECQGVNYDLMSQLEKIGVEEGFQQFLNTLRHPIQIYIQTRTINLENSVNTYKEKIKEIEDKYNRMNFQYNQMLETEEISKQDRDKYYYELVKQKNLLEYGKDIVANTEKMSFNKNVLNKKYYVIVPYYSEEIGEQKYDKEEIKNIAFSELYTKSQSVIRTLSACSITGRILTSNELVELLYMAYNRDDAEIFGVEKALASQYDSLYSTSPDVLEKKIKALDEIIQERAVDLANNTIEKIKAKPKLQTEAEKREENMDVLVRNLAELILNENKAYVGEEIAEEAIEKIKEEGEKQNEKNGKTSRRKKQSIK